MSDSLFLAIVLSSAMFLFYVRWLRPDVTALCAMVALMLPWRRDAEGEWSGVLSVQDAVSGFGSTALIMVASMFVISAAMVRTGAADLIGARILRAGARTELSFQVTVLIVVTLFSAFINDTTTVIIWMPMVLAVARERGYSAGRLLLPVAYASLLGGQWTLIGTRSNILISDYLRMRAGHDLGFFSFTPVAAAVFAAVLAFFVLVGRKLLPRGSAEVPLTERYEVAEFVTEVLAKAESKYVGQTPADLEQRFKVTILGVIRGGKNLRPDAALLLAPDDVLMIQGSIPSITTVLEEGGLQVQEQLVVGDQTLQSVDLAMVEAVVSPSSDYEGRTLEELEFAGTHEGLSVLAIGRHGRPTRGRPTEHRLRAGDSLLLIGHTDELARLRSDPGLFTLETKPFRALGKHRTWVTLAILAAVVLASAARVVHPGFAIPTGALLCVLTRCISMRQAYDSLNMGTLVVLGGLLPFGLALEETGTAALIGNHVHAVLEPYGLRAVFAALLLIAVLLTQLIENAAVAVILAPLAYELAVASGGSPDTFLLGLAVCISAAFMSPVAHESTILVLTPGGYRFGDYLKLGTPFALIAWAVTVLVVPLIYPLAAG